MPLTRRGPIVPLLALVPCAVALLTAGCDGNAAADDDAPLVFTAADVHVLGTSDSIARVEDLAVLADGSVWVQNSVEPLFVGFGPDGAVIGAHGRQGGGPDEFGAAAGFVVGGPADEVWTFDPRRHALVRVAGPGDGRAEVPLPRGEVPPGSVTGGMSLMSGLVRTAWLGDVVVLPRRSDAGEVSATAFWTTIWNADLAALEPGTDEVRSVVSLREAMGDLESHFQGLNPGFPPFPLWYRLWTTCGDEVRLLDFRRNQLLGYDPDGAELDPIPLPPPPFTAATPRQFVRAAFDLAAAEQAGAVTDRVGSMSSEDSTRLIEGAASRIDASSEQLGGILPAYVDLRCDDDGALWLRPLDLERGGMDGGPAWLRVARDGRAREVRFPDRFDPYRFTDGQAWGVLRDELDVGSVGWVEL